MKSWAAMFAVLLLTTTSAAQDLPRAPDEPPGDDVITDLDAGTRAPHRGILLDTDTAIRWRNRMQWYRNELALRIRLLDDTQRILIESHGRELEAVRASYEREIEGLRTDLREQAEEYAAQIRGPEWWETGTFGFAMGVLVTVLIAGATAILAVSL